MYLATGDHWLLDYTYDNLQRLRSRRLFGGIRWETLYAYRRQGTSTSTTSTMQIRYMTQEVGCAGTDCEERGCTRNNCAEMLHDVLRFRYLYDNIGQITEWVDPVNDAVHEYEYDAQNQLVAETIIGDRHHHEFTYHYDTFGNIRERRYWNRPPHTAPSPTRTMTFSYDYDLWPDLLTAVNGRQITYDQSGNPTRWHDGRQFTWERGRQLTHAQGNGLDVEFEYDVNGIRTEKIVTDLSVPITTRHTFYTQGGRIVAERRNMNGIIHTLEFFYDEAGRPLQMQFSNGRGVSRVFNYVLNLQGDVIQIRDASTGVVYANYLYNAWGELLHSDHNNRLLEGVYNMADINPIRYRSYFWCSAMGMYYLQSRYYCPTIGRFINADEFISTGQGLLGFNMFAYTGNNPVNRVDRDGRMWTTNWGSWGSWLPPGFPIPGGLAPAPAPGTGTQNQANSAPMASAAGQGAGGSQNNVRAPGPPLATAAGQSGAIWNPIRPSIAFTLPTPGWPSNYLTGNNSLRPRGQEPRASEQHPLGTPVIRIVERPSWEDVAHGVDFVALVAGPAVLIPGLNKVIGAAITITAFGYGFGRWTNWW